MTDDLIDHITCLKLCKILEFLKDQIYIQKNQRDITIEERMSKKFSLLFT